MTFSSHIADRPQAEVIARRCRALSDPIRIRLLDAVRASSGTIDELQLATGQDERETSRHLEVLRDAGLVSAVPAGDVWLYTPSRDATPCGCPEPQRAVTARPRSTHISPAWHSDPHTTSRRARGLEATVARYLHELSAGPR
jgi:DNA-binding transcriptional ArsR family regulator